MPERKSPGLAAVLALVLGFFILMGIGHIYVGRIKRGIAIMLVGLMFLPLAFITIAFIHPISFFRHYPFLARILNMANT